MQKISKGLSKNNLKKTYISVAVILLNTFILFLILNLLVLGTSTIYGLFNADSDSEPYNIEKRMQVYPNWSNEELENLYNSTWSRHEYIYEPYTEFKERPFNSKWVNIDPNGFRKVKNQAPWPPTEDAFNIFVFGGSTTFGYGIADSETIPSQIQEKLNYPPNSNGKISVYNFGRAHYFSSQERILFEKLITEGKIPDLVIFIDGLNDFFRSEDHQPSFTNRLERCFDDGKENKYYYSFLLNFPLVNFFNEKIKYAYTTYTVNINKNEKTINYSDEDSLNKTINMWLKNEKLIEAISNEFGIKTLFVIQPVPTYRYNLSYHLFLSENDLDRIGTHQYSIKGYELLAKRYKELSSDEKNNSLWLADIQENRKESLYVDGVHYTANFSEEIANYIVETIKNKNLI